MIEILDVAQGSPEWFAARLGIPTASCFADVLAKGEGKTRRKYLLQLAAERLTGRPVEGWGGNAHTERGKEQEEEARAFYALDHDVDPLLVGFARHPVHQAGCSPDSFIGASGMLEIKTRLPHLQVESLLKDEFPSEHKAQCQGALWICEREWIDLYMYSPGLPPLIKRMGRDEAYLLNLASEIRRFNEELTAITEVVRARF